MGNPVLPDHPMRYQLANELHARPFPVLTPPGRAGYLAFKKLENAAERDRQLDIDHLLELLDRHGASHPAPGASHYSGNLGRYFLKWEMHTEFVTYTFFSSDQKVDPFSSEAFNLFPADWMAAAPGRVVTSCLVRIEAVPKDGFQAHAEEHFPAWFVQESLSASYVTDGDAALASDFRIDEGGHVRFAVLARPDIDPNRLGRIVQRALEIETYKSMSMLTLPKARKISAAVARLERDLSDNVAAMAERAGNEAEILERLLGIAAEIELLSSTNAFRFGAFEAYAALVSQRVTALRENRIGGIQMLGEFMMRRYDPAMRTCRSARNQLSELSARAERAANLLRTSVDVANQAQNNEVLRQMDRRAAMQLRLQETVEGLSVVAISYYAVNLVAGLFAPLGSAVGLEKTTVLALLTLPVVGVVWAFVRRLRHKLTGGER